MPPLHHPETLLLVVIVATYIALGPRVPGLIAVETALAFEGIAHYVLLLAGKPELGQALVLVAGPGAVLAAVLLIAPMDEACGTQAADSLSIPATAFLALAILYGASTLSPFLGRFPTGLVAGAPGVAVVVLPMIYFVAGRRFLAGRRSERHLMGLIVLVGALGSGMAIAQRVMGPDALQAMSPSLWAVTLRDTTTSSTGLILWRTPGLAADAGRCAATALVAILAGLALLVEPPLGAGEEDATGPCSGTARTAFIVAGLLVSLVALVGSGVRSVTVALGVGIALMATRRPRALALGGTLGALGLVVALAVSGPGAIDRAADIVSGTHEWSARLAPLAEELASDWRRYPMGAGPGRAGAADNVWVEPNHRIVDHPSDSLPAALMLEVGPLGIAFAYGGFLVLLARGLFDPRLRRGAGAVAGTAAVAAFLVLSAAGPILHAPGVSGLLWLLAGGIDGGLTPGERSDSELAFET